MQHYIEATNTEIEKAISEKIHSERDRKIMHLRLVDGYTYERIAEMVEMSPRYIRALVRKLLEILNIS